MAFISVAFGFLALVIGGDFIIRSSAKLAASIGIPPLIVGLTVVALATSAPELAVVLQASFAGNVDLAIGNVVGSNICNILFVMGFSALVTPLVVTARLVRLDVPIMIGASILLLLISIDGKLGRWDGVLLITLLLCYVFWTVRESRKAKRVVKREFAEGFKPARGKELWIQLALFFSGLVLLVFGAHFTVVGCVSVAKSLGISELIIGLTVIAIGTSLPEVVTSIVASYRGERDIAVGNVIGSNMFNILGVLGLGSLIAPDGIGVPLNALRFDMPIMITVAVVCLPIFFVGNRISRLEGGLLFGYYIAYTSYLILHATSTGFGRALEVSLIFFAIPLTTITILTGVYRYWRKLQVESAKAE